MDYNFEKIQGPFNSKERNFEELISQLLILEENVRPIDGSGGDEGIDCYLRKHKDGLDVFQIKYFLKRLSGSQRNQIKRSFKKAIENHRVRRWILCIPINHTQSERIWFEKLSAESTKLEWWGETKLRTLLAKYPNVGKQFFKDDLLFNELRLFRKEVLNVITAVKSTCWSKEYIYPTENIPFLYFNRAISIGNIIIKDLSLYNSSKAPLIALDFSEIYSFLTSDPRFLSSTPIFDYCFNNSPTPFVILPATCVEMRDNIQYHLSEGSKIGRSRSETHGLEELLKAFIVAYETDSSSAFTFKQYNQIMTKLPFEELSSTFRLPELIKFLNSKKVKILDDDYMHIYNAQNDIDKIFDVFNMIRPKKHHANYIDALNINFVKQFWESSDKKIRMISSAPSFKNAARLALGDIDLVRTTLEYSYFLNTLISRENIEFNLPIEKCINELILLSEKLRDKFKNLTIEILIDDMTIEHQYDIIQSFLNFTPHYRYLLKPIDTMIVSGSLALPKMRSKKMQELYHFLKSEAQLVDGFMKWWDNVSVILKQFLEMMPITKIEQMIANKTNKITP